MSRRISQLATDQIRHARVVVLHAPQDVGDGQIRWSLSVVDLSGAVVARETVLAPDCPHPLTEVVRPYLDLIGRRVTGEWISDHDGQGQVRHRALIV
ncbi:hypothetical protein [Cellulomonas taurus]|jgi:hypothetical protein|uniref:hypothetical protein n=1 Tax=Cellulomonas taurus TaxID=2729175 RepID=UPI00145D89F5|nr:hypothetical protein [Cellulomonas taurus]